jgi:hypothetical protein
MNSNPGYEGADHSDPRTPARIRFNDDLAELLATAIQAGLTEAEITADTDAQISIQNF